MQTPENIEIYTAQEADNGLRLDYFLRSKDHKHSQRSAKRLCNNGHISINDKIAKAGQIIQAGDLVKVQTHDQKDIISTYQSLYDQVRIIKNQNGFYAIYKPTGLHSVKLKGATTPSLELYIELEWQKIWEQWQDACRNKQALYPGDAAEDAQHCCAGTDSETPPAPFLFNRLDQATSGIIICGDAKTYKSYLTAETYGKITKTYFAIVNGSLTKELDIDYELHNDNKTKMEARSVVSEARKQKPETLRHTLVEPVKQLSLAELHSFNAKFYEELEPIEPEYSGVYSAVYSAEEQQQAPESSTPESFTLVKAAITKGARHQIRAHLAEAGYPIVGDKLYNFKLPEQCKNQDLTLFLHHYKIELENFQAECEHPWA